MRSTSRQRFQAAVHQGEVDQALACLLIAAEAEPDLRPEPWLAYLDELAARVALPTAGTPTELARALGAALGEREGFHGDEWEYENLRASLLHEVLRRRRGLPILLSVVWLEVARRIGVPAYGVALPGHFAVGIGDPDGDHVLVDPFRRGMTLSPEAAAELVAELGGRLRPEHLRPADPVGILLRILTNISVWARLHEQPRVQLWAVELSLLLPRHPAELRRERGELLVRIGDFLGGAAELEAYAELIAGVDPQEAERTLAEARMARARLN